MLRQKIREAEKEALYNEYINKLDEIINGTVDRVEERFAIINIGKTGALLSSKDQIPGETLVEGEHVKVYVSEVERTTKGTHISVSRTHEGLVKRLFEMEVPEIFEGTVEIKSVSREAGERSKIAVYTANPDIDPIGACVGPKGNRVRNVVEELNGEMIDIIEWSDDPVTFISHALSPAKVERVKLNHAKNSALVVVPDDQLSLAIGKRGQNARLAVKLTNWKIDIKSVSEILEEGIDLDAPEVDMELLEKMKKSMEEHEADEEKETIMMQCRPKDTDKGQGDLLDIRETQRVEYTLSNILSNEWIVANPENCPVLGGVATFGFGDAVKYLKRGLKVKRIGWNGKNQFIQLATGISYKATDGAIVNCDHEAIGNKAIAFIGTSGVQMGWLASQADMLAEDWMFAE